ncbi:MAG: polysaccharide deacetylase family protein [Luteimonas sp.]
MSIPAIRQRFLRTARYWIALCAHHTGLDFLYRRITGAGLVVLMLHRLRDEHDPYPLSTSKASFQQLVRWMRERDVLVSLDDGLDALSDPHHAEVNYAITFDDGYRDNLALIDMRSEAVPAIVYVVTGHVGGEPIWVYRLHQAVESRTRDRLDLGWLGLGHFDLSDADERERLYALLPPRLKELDPHALDHCIHNVFEQTQPRALPQEQREMLNWQEIRNLERNGVQIGAHTRNHVLLSRADAGMARSEIIGSHADIIAAIDVPPAHFAYPNGGASDFGDRDIDIVRQAGFKTAVTSVEGINRRGTDPYRILRHNVHEDRYRAPHGRLSPALFFSETSGLLGWLRTRRVA